MTSIDLRGSALLAVEGIQLPPQILSPRAANAGQHVICPVVAGDAHKASFDRDRGYFGDKGRFVGSRPVRHMIRSSGGETGTNAIGRGRASGLNSCFRGKIATELGSVSYRTEDVASCAVSA